MDREIKFRGKNLLTEKDWIFGDLQTSGFYAIGDKRGIYRDVITDTVGQYTGLKDKNGKEIYEGDIIKAHSGRLYQILFGEFKLDVKREFPPVIDRYQINGWCIKYKGKVDCLDSEVCSGEVVGNIYDNPELIEKGE